MRLPFPSLPVSMRFRVILLALCFLIGGLENLVATAQLSSRFAPTPGGTQLSGTSPLVLAESDVSGDGKLDLVVASYASSTSTALTVSYRPGNGTGGFGSAITMATLPSNYRVLASGDFNHDGRLDLILFQSATSRILPMLGTATHGFSTGTSFACSACGPGGPAAMGDFNKDTNLDVILANTKSGTLVALLGNGNGTFRSPVVSQGFTTAYFAMIVGDFNRDGLPDLVVADGETTLQTAFGNGNGSFRAGSPFTATAPFETALLSADITGDGKLDLIVPTDGGAAVQFCPDGSPIYILPGNGDGTFGAGKIYSAGIIPSSAVINDFNGDGRPDIVTFNTFSNSFSVLLNLGSGKLAPAVSYKTGLPTVYFSNLFDGDLNGDKRPDLAIVSQDKVATVITQPGGTFHAANAAELSIYPHLISPPVDLNHDGIPDLIAVGSTGCKYDIGDGVSILSSNGTPLNKIDGISFYNPPTSNPGIGDFNGDGNLDAAMLGSFFGPPQTQDIYLNDGHGNLTSVGGTSPTTNATALAVGDFNRDGKSDLALIDAGEIQIKLGMGGQNFKPPVSYSAAGHPVAIAVRDLNGDGKQDLVAVNQGNDSISVLLGRGDGTFNAAKSYPVADGPFQVAFADFNRDGKVDIVVADTNQLSVLLGNGNGTFASAHNYPAGTPLVSLATADLRGNGDADVLVGAKSGDLLWFPGAGNGTLGTAQHYAARGAALLQVGDFNRDGAPDVILSGPGGTAISLLYNRGGTHIGLTTNVATITLGQAVTFTASIGASLPNSGTPTGYIAFRDGTRTIATVTVTNGKATFTTSGLARGTHSITALYNGSTTFNPHLSGTVTVIVK